MIAKSDVVLSVENRSSSVISDVQIRALGSTRALGRIAPGRVVDLRIQTRDESGVSLWYTDYLGREFEKTLEVFIDPRLRGKITIAVGGDGEITIVNKATR